MACDQVKEYLENGNIINSVNYPAVSLPRSGDKRICVMHKNVPERISDALSGVTVVGMLTKNRGDYAYTIVDVKGVVDVKGGADADKLAAVDGVIKVRVL